MKRRGFIASLAAMVAARKLALPPEPDPIFPVQFKHHETVFSIGNPAPESAMLRQFVPVTGSPDGGVRYTRNGLPSVYWKKVNADDLASIMLRSNEILLELPWVEGKRGS